MKEGDFVIYPSPLQGEAGRGDLKKATSRKPLLVKDGYQKPSPFLKGD